MVRAARRLALMAQKGDLLPADLSETQLMNALSTRTLPDVDLLMNIRGVPDIRILPLEACYAELYFTETLWPDFTEADLDAACVEYSRRQRRFDW